MTGIAGGAIGIVAAATTISALLARRLADPASMFYVLDHPNARSMHSTPTPRTGGVAILSAIGIVGCALAAVIDEAWRVLGWLALALAIVAVTSLLDDRRSLSAGLRFVLHIAAAVAVTGSGMLVNSTWLPGPAAAIATSIAVPVTIGAIVWMLELYNFMDGLDGLAGGMTVIGFGALALLALNGGQPLVAGLALTTAAAGLGFLVHNFPPARIFMGDVGSAPLGLLAASLSLWGAHTGAFPLWSAVLVFSPFIVDASVTIVRRLYRQEKIWEAHKTHYYQRLAQLGWPHRRIIAAEYGLMTAAAAAAIWGVRQPVATQWALLAAWTLAYVVLAVSVDRLDVAHRATVRHLATR